ncbi:hypothetical protein [Aeromonas hydrophila]|uniref:hypothetical protein n=1 Tax=Aeromonas hydrophila TaxID=644 RepID=UPI002B46B97A|nr:hypothetical protein [Aeromonas hydrophila]
MTNNRVDADEVAGRRADASDGKFHKDFEIHHKKQEKKDMLHQALNNQAQGQRLEFDV